MNSCIDTEGTSLQFVRLKQLPEIVSEWKLKLDPIRECLSPATLLYCPRISDTITKPILHNDFLKPDRPARQTSHTESWRILIIFAAKPHPVLELHERSSDISVISCGMLPNGSRILQNVVFKR